MRLDIYILQKFSLKSRNFAENLIKKGKVTVNNVPVDKPAYDVGDNDVVAIFSEDEFESLGGDKLNKALDVFNISLQDKLCVDIGAANGGFTDCMLRRGASSVYAVDVADCALSDKLKNDNRVFVREHINAREIIVKDVDGKKDFLSIDVSFISLKLVLIPCFNLLKEDGRAVVLIKPQFELGRKANKSGIVLNPKDRLEIINDVISFAAAAGINCLGITTVPRNFKNKNIEYLAYLSRKTDGCKVISSVSQEIFKTL